MFNEKEFKLSTLMNDLLITERIHLLYFKLFSPTIVMLLKTFDIKQTARNLSYILPFRFDGFHGAPCFSFRNFFMCTTFFRYGFYGFHWGSCVSFAWPLYRTRTDKNGKFVRPWKSYYLKYVQNCGLTDFKVVRNK